MTSDGCFRCHGKGWLPVRVVDCPAVDAGELCEDHPVHFDWKKRCWLCLGSGAEGMEGKLWTKLKSLLR